MKEFEVTKEELTDLMKAYIQRTAHEDIEEIGRHGGMAGLAKKIDTDLERGVVSGESIEHRKEVYGLNRFPEKKPTSFLMLCWQALQDFTLRILLVCALVSFVLALTLGERPDIEWIEGVAIFVAVLIVVMVTAVNDWKKEQQFKKLNEMKDDKECSLIRGDIVSKYSVFEVVVGDILSVETGDEVPADGLLISGYNLKMDESSLTGETESIAKSPFDVCKQQIADRQEKLEKATGKKHHVIDSPVVLSGTTVTNGSGLILVLAVGQASQVGRVMELLSAPSEATPLQLKLEAIAQDVGRLGLYAALLTILVLIIEFWIVYGLDKENQPSTMQAVREHLHFLIIAITIVVVAVPEGLPLAVTISLAFSINKMLADQNWVRRLAACEIMGGANEICSDKTGTLTRNRMTVEALWNGWEVKDYERSPPRKEEFIGEHLDILVEAIAVNSTAYLEFQNIEIQDGTGRFKEVINHVGSPTECALLQFMQSMDYDYHHLRKDYPIIHVEQFNSERKIMTTVIQHPTQQNMYRVFVKGASERVLRLCTSCFDCNGLKEPLSREDISKIEHTIIHQLASQALRTICLAYRDFDPSALPDWKEQDPDTLIYKMETDLVCLGITGIRDPVRTEVPDAVKKCQRAGIKVRMVTGDNIDTAKQIAIRCNIYNPGKAGLAMLGRDFLQKIGGVICESCKTEVCDCPRDPTQAAESGKEIRNDVLGKPEEFSKIADHLEVLARSQPSDKYALVTGLRNMGQVVAVTGDGTNDAPALKKADVGFAMGIAGKEVAKQASDIVLLDDNFESIVKAVKWGRNIYDNIRRFLQFQITVNIVAVATAFLSSVILRESPIGPIHLLWLNLIMDTFGSLALATKPPTEDLLERQPYRKDEYIISKIMWRNILGQATYQLAVMLMLIFAGDSFIPEYGCECNVDEERCRKSQKILCDDDGTIVSGRRYFIGSYGKKDEDYSHDMWNDHGPSRHYTIVFNTFVFLQVFNMMNARKIHNEFYILEGLLQSRMWGIIWTIIVLAQFLMVQYGGIAVNCHLNGLAAMHWLISVAIGFGSLPMAFLLRFIPVQRFPEYGIREAEGEDITNKIKRGQSTFSDRGRVRSSLRSNSPPGSPGRVSKESKYMTARTSTPGSPGDRPEARYKIGQVAPLPPTIEEVRADVDR
ncbi:unnamed protein product [Vitrella brassicaformis CCMP3155]|uniref:Cation-transporting P-type ATPase N-terminal domain-containing protein n=4 Tax=Vitrella brassicaformis TaxID=1169539 RepID=A0A0G4ETW8_VITBC|nr:unnamed protein product [Vitrella brassicaformis CCMP3155]|eukprot:CEM02072.1 unnamed protein product [Vitrella brassicaformis CCMP3155]